MKRWLYLGGITLMFLLWISGALLVMYADYLALVDALAKDSSMHNLDTYYGLLLFSFLYVSIGVVVIKALIGVVNHLIALKD